MNFFFLFSIIHLSFLCSWINNMFKLNLLLLHIRYHFCYILNACTLWCYVLKYKWKRFPYLFFSILMIIWFCFCLIHLAHLLEILIYAYFIIIPSIYHSRKFIPTFAPKKNLLFWMQIEMRNRKKLRHMCVYSYSVLL